MPAPDSILRLWTVYKHPVDYPDKFVARLFEVAGGSSRPTDSIIIASTLEHVREHMIEMQLTRIDRQPGENPVIVEVWL